MRVAALVATALAGSVGLSLAVASHAATPTSPSIAIFAVPSSDYSAAPGSPVLPVTSIGPAAGSSQNEWFILTSASGTSVLQEPVGGGTPTVTATNLGSPSGGYPAMVSADGLDWAVADTDGVHGGLFAIDSSGNATRVAMPGYDPSQDKEQIDVFEDMTVAPDGNLYLTDSGTGYVYQCAISAIPSPSASCGPTPGVPCGASPVPYDYDCNGPSNGLLPKSIASAGGKLWINDNSRNIVSMTTSGAFAGPFAQSDGSGNASYSPRTLVAADGFLWSVGGFADGTGENSEILKIDPASGAVVATYQAGEALALTVDAAGNIWYVGQNSAGASGVGELDPTTGTIVFTAAPAGSFVPYPENQYPLDPAGGEAIAPGPAGSNTLFFTGQNGSGAPIIGEVTVSSTSTTTTTTSTTTTTTTTTPTTTTSGCKSVEVRPEFRDESSTQLQQFITAMRDMQSGPPPTPFDKFVKVHADLGTVIHDFADFLPWHREFLLQFEQALQKYVPGVVIPYWDAAFDASDPQDSPIWSASTFGGNGNPDVLDPDGNPVVTTGQFNNTVYHPFSWVPTTEDGELNPGPALERNWSTGSANPTPGFTLGPFEGPDGIKRLIASSTSYDTLRQGLAYGEHALVHDYIGGDMQLTVSSPDDPVFWMFHAWLDYVWSQWQAESPANATAYGGLNFDGSTAKLSDPLPGFPGVTVGSVMSISSLCYSYQPLSVSPPATPTSSAQSLSPPATPTSFARSLLRAGVGMATSVSVISRASAIAPHHSVTLIASSQSTQGAGKVKFSRDGRPIAHCAAVPLRWTGHTWQAICKAHGLRARRRPHAIRAELLAVGAYASSHASVAGGVRVTTLAPKVTFKRPRTALYGNPIGARVLHAVAREPGTFRYTAAPVTAATDMRRVTARSVLAAGEYDLRARFIPAHRAPAQAVTVQYVVAPAPLQIRPDRKYMALGQPTPQVTWVASGFVNHDTPSSLLQSPACVIAAGTLTIGNHKIWCQGGYSPNYTISYPATATLTVLRHPCPIGSSCATNPPLTSAERSDTKILELICHPPIPASKTTLIHRTRRRNGVRTTTWRGRIT